MRLSLFVLWALAGWCTVGAPRISLRVPRPGLDIPEPPPRPEWLLLRTIGVVGGLVGGWVFTAAFGWPVPWITASPQPEPWMPVVVAAATTVGAFLGGRLLVDIYALVAGSRNVSRGQQS